MAETTSRPSAPVTAEVFERERRRFWHSFLSLVLGAVISIVVLLILLAYFLT